jgi:hypothetical protein
MVTMDQLRSTGDNDHQEEEDGKPKKSNRYYGGTSTEYEGR